MNVMRNKRSKALKYILPASAFLAFILMSFAFSPEPVWGLQSTQLEVEAERGDADAAYFLGVMYRTGMNVSSDCSKALKWTRQAALQGHTLAQSHLGRIYNDGCDGEVEKDPLKAYIWTALAAKQGLRYAEKNLKTLENQLHPYLLTEAQEKVENFEPEK